MNKSLALTLICLVPFNTLCAETKVEKETLIQKIAKKKDLIKRGAIITLVIVGGASNAYLINENQDLKAENARIKISKDQSNSMVKQMAKVFLRFNEVRKQFHDLNEAFEKIKANTEDEKIQSVDGEIVFRSMASRDLMEFENKFDNFTALLKSSPHSLEDITKE